MERPVRFEARAAPPGAAFVRLGAAVVSELSHTALELRWVPEGNVEMAGATSIPLGESGSVAVGLAGSIGEALGVRFGIALDEGAAWEVQWPILQHPSMPLRTVWRAGRRLDFGRGARGAVFGGWSPGRPPRVHFYAGRHEWTVAIGSSGVSLSRNSTLKGFSIRWWLGVMRAGIPWAGVMTDSPWATVPVEFPASPLWAWE